MGRGSAAWRASVSSAHCGQRFKAVVVRRPPGAGVVGELAPDDQLIEIGFRPGTDAPPSLPRPGRVLRQLRRRPLLVAHHRREDFMRGQMTEVQIRRQTAGAVIVRMVVSEVVVAEPVGDEGLAGRLARRTTPPRIATTGTAWSMGSARRAAGSPASRARSQPASDRGSPTESSTADEGRRRRPAARPEMPGDACGAVSARAGENAPPSRRCGRSISAAGCRCCRPPRA